MGGVKAYEGQWYENRSNHDIFCVIAVDESEGFVDVRDCYGDIDEFDLAEWEAMDLEICRAPADWGLYVELDGEDDLTSGDGAAEADASHHRKSSGTM